MNSKSIIYIGMAVSVLLLILLSYPLNLFLDKDFILNQHKQEMIEILNLKGTQIDDFFDSKIGRGLIISNSPAILKYFKEDTGNTKILINDLENAKEIHKLTNIFLFKNFTSFLNLENLNDEKQVYKFYNYMVDNKKNQSLDYSILNNSQAHVHTFYKIFINNTKEGFVVLEYSLNDLDKIMSKKNLDDIDDIYLLNKNLISITGTNKKNIGLLIDNKESIECFNNIEEKVKIYNNYKNEKVLGVHKYFPDKEVCLILETDYNKFKEKYNEKNKIRVYKIFSIFLFFLSLLLAFIINKLYVIKKTKNKK